MRLVSNDLLDVRVYRNAKRKTIMKKQHWFCENCNSKSFVFYEQGEDLYSVVNKITEKHKTLSPDCETGVSLVRVVNNEKDI